MAQHIKTSYWFPLLLPVLMGVILAFAKLPSDFSETRTQHMMAQQIIEHMKEEGTEVERDALPTPYANLAVDGKRFLQRISEGLVLSIIAIDVWAFTTLFAAAAASLVAKRLPYEYPVIGIIAHFILVLVVAASDALQIEEYEVVTQAASVIAAIAALGVGWWVRHGIWNTLEREHKDGSEGMEDATNIGR